MRIKKETVKVLPALFFRRVGDLLEHGLDAGMEAAGLQAPPAGDPPQRGKWYRLEINGGMSGDGSEYHIYIKHGRSDRLCVFLSGGGMAWDEHSAASPVTGGRFAARMPGYYWSNLRPVSELMNISAGIMDGSREDNPFADWSFAVITYATGDMHFGDGSLDYTDAQGNGRTLHFHGRENFRLAIGECRKRFKEPGTLLIAGDSAGAFAVPALAGEIIRDYYPDCMNVILFSDSAMLECGEWRHMLRDVWNAPESIWGRVTSDNAVADWYESLRNGDFGDRRLKFLFACSTEDYLLGSYQNEFDTGSFETDAHTRRLFNKRLKGMLRRLKSIDSEFDFFIYDWKNPLYTGGGTVHTAVRMPYFYKKTPGGISMAQWLAGHVEGKGASVFPAVRRKKR